MVEKLTLIELHLDEARFSNAVGGTPEAAEVLLGEMEAEETEVASEDVEESSGRSVGGRLLMAALAVVVAVAIRTVARRLLGDEDALGEIVESESGVEVDVDEPVEA